MLPYIAYMDPMGYVETGILDINPSRHSLVLSDVVSQVNIFGSPMLASISWRKVPQRT